MPPEKNALKRLHAFLLNMHFSEAIGEPLLLEMQADLNELIKDEYAKGYSAGYTDGHVKGAEHIQEMLANPETRAAVTW